jgi:AraC-like DNA-binding protein
VFLPSGSPAASSASRGLSLWPPVFAVWGTGHRSSLHSHHAWHLIVGVDGPGLFQRSARARPVYADAYLTRPDVPHASDADGRWVLVIFVNPESDVGAQLGAIAAESITVLEPGPVARIRAALGPLRTREELARGAARALAELGVGPGRSAIRHPAIRRVLGHLRSAAPGADESLEALAALAGLSPSRFLHVFSREVGIPLRPYLRWLKLERAANLLRTDASLADVAYAAGFSDAAHMSRTFRAMLGTTPSFLRSSQSIQAS